MSHSYTVHIDYTQFREYLVENDDAGPWGDTYFHEVFDKYVEDNSIEIEYKYGDYKNGKTTILWRLAAEEGKGKVYQVRYGGSSRFAMWWCGITDDLEDEEEENDNGRACERCGTTTCPSDSAYPCRLLWESNKTGKEICRCCVAAEDAEDE